MAPFVSIVMPCYNHSSFVTDSILGILNQSFSDFELIITDDCSTDGSKGIIKTFAQKDRRIIPIYHDKRGGVSKSRNDALRVAKGDFIGFCDADDIWERDKLSKQINYLDSMPEYGAVHSDAIIIDENNKPTKETFSNIYYDGPIPIGNLFLKLCIRNFINTQTVLVRKRCIESAGLFNEKFIYMEDWIYWVKIAHKNLFAYLNEPLARYRIHSGSTFHDRKNYQINWVMGYRLLLETYYNEIPKNVRSLMEYKIGVNYLHLGNMGEAQQYFAKSIRACPWNLKAVYRLLESKVRKGNE